MSVPTTDMSFLSACVDGVCVILIQPPYRLIDLLLMLAAVGHPLLRTVEAEVLSAAHPLPLA